MESFIHADIFFFVSTIAVALLVVAIVIVLIYVIKILHDMKHISSKVRKESDEVINDIHSLRQHIKTEGLTIRYLSSFFRGLMSKRKSKKE